jgi:DNA ligase-1
MRAFAKLWAILADETDRVRQERLLEDYFRKATPSDSASAVNFLIGSRSVPLAAPGDLLEWAVAEAGIPGWLASECLKTTGDPLEAAALLIQTPEGVDEFSLSEIKDRLAQIAELPDGERRGAIVAVWRGMGAAEILVFNKLLCGGLRWREARQCLARTLAVVAGADAPTMARRLEGWGGDSGEAFAGLISSRAEFGEGAGLYPFARRRPLGDRDRAGEPASAWRFLIDWPGERIQLILRRGRAMLWSIEQEDVTDRFPEIGEAAKSLPDGTVLEGIVSGWRDGHPATLGEARGRRSRRTAARSMVLESPAVFLSTDLLEINGRALAASRFSDRLREMEIALARVGAGMPIKLSEAVAVSTWEDAEALARRAKESGASGVLARRLSGADGTDSGEYGWVELKAPLSRIDAVLLSLERGRGGRGSGFRKLTFGVWAGNRLVPVAETGVEIAGNELLELDELVERHALDRFGSVVAVSPIWVFEIAHEGTRESPRRKAGLVLVNPRVIRRRRDRAPAEAARVEELRRGCQKVIPQGNPEPKEQMLPFRNLDALDAPHGSGNLFNAPGEGSGRFCGDR